MSIDLRIQWYNGIIVLLVCIKNIDNNEICQSKLFYKQLFVNISNCFIIN